MFESVTLDQLRMLIAIADAGSFRSAARRVQRAQSAVSHAIASLEAQLDIELFDRSGYRPVLTSEGALILADARRVLANAESLKARARSFKTGVELTLDLAIDPFMEMTAFTEAIKAVHQHYPQVAVRIRSAPLGAPIQAVRDQVSQLGLSVSDELRDDSLVMEPAGQITLVAVAADGQPLTEMASPVDVSDHLNIVIADPTHVTAGVDFGVGGPRTWRVDDLETKRRLIISGLGWGSMPYHHVKTDLETGRLIRISPQGIWRGVETPMPVYLIRRRELSLGPAAQRFRHALLAILEK